jgi:hypothetical protein
MSAAQTHPTTVQYPARSGFSAALALIALVALAIVAFAAGQSGLLVGPRACRLSGAARRRDQHRSAGRSHQPDRGLLGGRGIGEGDRHSDRCGAGALDGRSRPLGRGKGQGGRARAAERPRRWRCFPLPVRRTR